MRYIKPAVYMCYKFCHIDATERNLVNNFMTRVAEKKVAGWHRRVRLRPRYLTNVRRVPLSPRPENNEVVDTNYFYDYTT